MIPFFDVRLSSLGFKDEIDEAIRRVLASGQLILGPEVRAFEEEFASYVGVGGAVGVGSGTDALILALRALGVGPGDEVITVANAGVPTVAAIRAVGATPRFVDVRPDGLLIDEEQLEQAICPRTRCLLPIHLYGRAVAMEPILRLASRHGLRIIEDCAQAHGARCQGRHVGTFGDLGCFSFYPTKNLGAFGDGGMVVSNDPCLVEQVRMQRMYGFKEDRYSYCEGINSRLDELQAAILRVKLRHLPACVEARRTIARRYLVGLEGCIDSLPIAPSVEAHAYHLFVVQVSDRQRFVDALRGEGIGHGVHYPVPVHLMDAYRFLGYEEGELPVTERSAKAVLSLPMYPGLEAGAVDRVIETLRRVR
ncbi:MAG: DegT/DnrJ/EryC1/StrS family aminotransferase [Candidatus Eisenbacteria bacterium]|nr:DegT/DnrJ/EryC1/StrS family aminotransferase [Candidatus Eisenbacteria bacterium]